jgi:hypothetical protein
VSLDISTRSELHRYMTEVLPANMFHTAAYYKGDYEQDTDAA